MHRFPAALRSEYERLQPAIRKRLLDFKQTPPEERFYELCYCLLTPQSKALRANEVTAALQSGKFYETGFDPAPLLKSPQTYIRFHNVKTARLLEARERWEEIRSALDSERSAAEKRALLVERVHGLGWKEASHYLRNIGYEGLAILDRHILKHLTLCGVFDAPPKVGARRAYLEAEGEFRRFAAWAGIPMDELDLFFWAKETGVILK